jgi:muramoyltetrapeptide carboxypeptidase LdcA involved in peptidoglycan recycling/CubicO group peptidase (beta-lactamase class C family)
LLIPPTLAHDALVHVMHAAGRADRDALDRGIARLQRAGLSVVTDPTLPVDVAAPPGAAGRPYLAAPDAVRAADVRAALCTPGVAAAISARGGYGCARLLPALADVDLRVDPRWIVGYSDITALHLWSFGQGVASIHGPLVAGLGGADDATFDALMTLLRTGVAPSFAGLRATSGQSAAGRLIGGNLSIVASLVGTPWLPSFRGELVFFEEIAEARYRVDRLFTQIVQSGALDGVAGIALGRFSPIAAESEAEVLEVALECLRPLGVPIVCGVEAGHQGINLPLLFGATYVLDGSAGTLAPRVAAGAAAQARASAPARRGGSAGRVLTIVEDAVARGVCSGIAVEASIGGEVTLRLTAGATARAADVPAEAVVPTTLFDLASLTKPLSTAIIAQHLIERGAVTLDELVPTDLCAARATLRQLLRHTSGLPAHEAVFEAARRSAHPARFARDRFAAIAAEAAPDERHVYSDIGYVALGRWLERLGGASLSALFTRIVAEPLGLDAAFGDGGANGFGARVVATEWCPWRGATLHGVVHDENAQVLGGAAGHAGLFATGAAVGRVARSLLGHGAAVLAPDRVSAMWDVSERFGPGKHVLGWDTPGSELSMAGRRLRHDSTVGHLGFTGTSVWIEREREIVVVVLTNRVHPCRDETRIRELRPLLNDALVGMMTGE